MPHHPPPKDAREQAFLDKAASAIRAVRFMRRQHPNSAASRAYYAVHNAMNGRFGSAFPTDHGASTRPAILAAIGLEPDDARRIERLYRGRRIADYAPRAVSAGQAEAAMLDADHILKRLGVDCT
jgi:hypothetical protein